MEGGRGKKINTTLLTTTSFKKEKEAYHVLHKVPSGEGPYGKAKHAQLVEKDPEAAIIWFWEAINSGDRADSALKDMAVVMRQLGRTEEAIEAIKSFRSRCSKQTQDSLDNVLIDLYKKCGMAEEQIELVKKKLRLIYLGESFNGKPTKTARSHGKKYQVSIKQEMSKLLGNLGWAYMQKEDFLRAEAIYQKAQMIDPDANKACNLATCLIKQGRSNEARLVLHSILHENLPGAEDCKAQKRAQDLLAEMGPNLPQLEYKNTMEGDGLIDEDEFMRSLEQWMIEWVPSASKSKRLPIFEEISSFRDQITC